jgi:hypothetical protein
VIGSEQYRRDDNQNIAIIQVDSKQVTRTTTEHNFLAECYKREAEDTIDEMEPPMRFREAAQYCCR